MREGGDAMVAVAMELDVVSGWVFDSYLLGGLVWFGMLLPLLCDPHVPVSLKEKGLWIERTTDEVHFVFGRLG
jgi:hypothetical protein